MEVVEGDAREDLAQRFETASARSVSFAGSRAAAAHDAGS